MSLKLTYQIPTEYDQKALRDFLKRIDISKKALSATKHRGGDLLINGEHVTVRYVLNRGELLTVIFPQEERSDGLIPYEWPLEIVYEDEYLLVLNKPPLLPSIPSIRYPHKTLANAIVAYYELKKIKSTVHFVNRLDRDTSGLLVVAKYRHIHHLLTKDLKLIKRQYLALVKGQLEQKCGNIENFIAREREGHVKRCVRDDGDYALTRYEVLAQYDEMSLVRCTLHTGRTHQIRVHLTHLNHPLIGDTLYDELATQLPEGHLLHSYKLSFTHPITKQALSFETPLPSRFEAMINQK